MRGKSVGQWCEEMAAVVADSVNTTFSNALPGPPWKREGWSDWYIRKSEFIHAGGTEAEWQEQERPMLEWLAAERWTPPLPGYCVCGHPKMPQHDPAAYHNADQRRVHYGCSDCYCTAFVTEGPVITSGDKPTVVIMHVDESPTGKTTSLMSWIPTK